MRMTLDELATVSRFAKALERLPDDFLGSATLRFAAYPVVWLTADDYARIDEAALRAERLRRAACVGAGFGAIREAA